MTSFNRVGIISIILLIGWLSFNPASFTSADAEFVQTFGSSGSSNDQFSYPGSVLVNGTHIIIADGGNDRVQIFEFSSVTLTQTYTEIQTDTETQTNTEIITETETQMSPTVTETSPAKIITNNQTITLPPDTITQQGTKIVTSTILRTEVSSRITQITNVKSETPYSGFLVLVLSSCAIVFVVRKFNN